MRRLVLMLAVVMALPLHAEWIYVTPRGFNFFFNSTGAGYARWNAAGMFIVEQVVRGSLSATEPYEQRLCVGIVPGDLYFISRNCAGGECLVAFAVERDAPELLQYLKRAHAETPDTVLKKAVQWLSGRLPREKFVAWIGDVDPKDDDFTVTLVDVLENLALNIGDMPEGTNADAELQAFVSLVRELQPADTEERDEMEVDILAALEKASDAVWATIPRRQ
ncbi:MAG: hypothetical protein QOJ98_2024 [Acidobacteriota bacterium]|jgi:hypothetical protein|nr:hypothetical protein [Acidobacteriota bacterium]